MKKWVLLGLVFVCSCSIFAIELEMPSIFADKMVLQCGQNVPVWGTADAGAAVVLKFAGQEKRTVANTDGNWRVDLDAMDASTQSRVLTVVAALDGETVERSIADVLVGEVWLAGGQSNMYRPFRMLIHPAVDSTYEPVAEYLRQEAATANDPLFRQFRVGIDYSPLEGKTAGRGNWSQAIAGEVNEICCTAYFFGRELRRELKVPVALISCNLGGTRIEPWIPPQAYKNNDTLKTYYDREMAAYQKRLKNLDDNKGAGKTEDPSRDKGVPGTLYNGMVHPLIPYGIRGAIWYQGESNSGHFPKEYGNRLIALINGWRVAWRQEKFDFYWCQLANYKKVNDEPVGDEDGWALVQDGQQYAMKLPDTGMAVLNDIGETRDVHPKNKIDAGKRLSLWPLKHIYGKELVFSGPLYKEAKLDAGKVIVTFDHVGSGLMVGHKHLMEPTVEVNEPLKRFQICGDDRRWKWAQAKIVGTDTVAVWHDDIQEPVEVRYAWSSNPQGANLYNKEGLPASLFRTENLQTK